MTVRLVRQRQGSQHQWHLRALTSQHCPWGSTQDFLGSAPMRAVPIWWAENIVKAFFLMPACKGSLHQHTRKGRGIEVDLLSAATHRLIGRSTNLLLQDLPDASQLSIFGIGCSHKWNAQDSGLALRLKVHMDMHVGAEGALTLLAHAHEVLLEGERVFHSPA